MVTTEKQKTNLDDVLAKFGMFRPYHGQLCLYLGLAYASNIAYSSNYIFAAEEDGYRCADADFINNTCGVINSKKCAEFIYENSNSFVAEFQLACQDWKRTLVGTVHSLAYMLGLLFVGPLSDRIGRKPMIVITGVLGGILGIAKSFATSYWVYIVLEFLESAFGDIYSPAYILNVEIVTNTQRVPYFAIANIGYCVGAVYIALIAWLLPYWRNYLRVLYSPALLFFFYFFLIDESPRWLLSKGKKAQAVKIIEKMAKKNKITMEENELEKLACEVEKKEDIKFFAVLKNTFSSRTLIQRLLVCVVWWMTSTFVNYGMSITSVLLQGDKYINYALVAITEVPGIFLAMYVLMNYRRKYPLIGSFFLAGLFCIGQPFLPNKLAWLSLLMFMIGKLMASLYFNITYIYTSELFPTYTRNSMHAICSSLGRIGSIVAPQTPLLAVYWDGLPSLIFGIVSIVAGLLTFSVSDVANISLPDTVTEAEAIGTKVPDKNKTDDTVL
ncbi:unnamed protein product [Arctia plantaginis]|uniref:Major facilitator superfamily (MFS) profile domain-containing protein n=1 Tax=Arctia plantaginis TaxID=874455 RepID=A0A8S0YMT0_ARCPL|nr:unnamed protein product [Arctia plantaginis]